MFSNLFSVTRRLRTLMRPQSRGRICGVPVPDDRVLSTMHAIVRSQCEDASRV